MGRPACFVLWVCAWVAAPTQASADERMCLEAGRLISMEAEEGRSPVAWAQSLEDWAVALEASSTLQRSALGEAEPAGDMGDGAILWCASPNDPRCTARHGAPHGPRVPAREVGSCITHAVPDVGDAALVGRLPGPTCADLTRPAYGHLPERPPRPRR